MTGIIVFTMQISKRSSIDVMIKTPLNLDRLAWALARIMAEAEGATVEAVEIKKGGKNDS